jgi:hypothetical protein
MSAPQIKVPAGYATVSYGIPGLTESTTAIGALVIKSISYPRTMEVSELEGNTGFISGLIKKKASAAGVGGTKYNKEEITITCLPGTHASKTFPEPDAVVTISGLTAGASPWARLDGEWLVLSDDLSANQNSPNDISFKLARYCDIDLSP